MENKVVENETPATETVFAGGKVTNLIEKLFKKKSVLTLTDRINLIKVQNFFRDYGYNLDMSEDRRNVHSVTEFTKLCLVKNDVNIDLIWLDFLDLCDNLKYSSFFAKEKQDDFYLKFLHQLSSDLSDTTGLNRSERRIAARLHDTIVNNLNCVEMTMDYVRTEFDTDPQEVSFRKI